MTMPAAETIEREQGKLYLSDAEMIRRLGVPENIFVKPDLSGSPGRVQAFSKHAT